MQQSFTLRRYFTAQGTASFLAAQSALIQGAQERGLPIARVFHEHAHSDSSDPFCGRQNPGGASGEREHQSRMSQQYLAYAQWSADLQRHTLEQRWQSQQDIQAGRRDALGGAVRLRDPGTGETFEATASDRYHFRVNGAQRPTVLGSDSDFKPVSNLDLTRLLQIGTEVAR